MYNCEVDIVAEMARLNSLLPIFASVGALSVDSGRGGN